MANTTSIAVGCAVGIPVFLSVIIAFIFYLKMRKRLAKEDIEFQEHEAFQEDTHEISYDNIDELRLQPKEKDIETAQNSSPSETSDDGNVTTLEKTQEDKPKQQRYVPAYRKKFKSSVTNLHGSRNGSRNSSFSNLNLVNAGSASSINLSNTNSNNNVNNTDTFYDNVPVIGSGQSTGELDSDRTSQHLARSLQQPTPSFQKRPTMHRSASSISSTANTEDYDLKNNYDVANEHEIQEEDQYENEFTNYSENKRAYIESLRPKQN